ncbi:MAG: deoxyribose-phosphate aldolase [Crocinitomicaceae bacterium]
MKLFEIIPFVDYTSLNNFESVESITSFVEKAIGYHQRGYSVAGVCTYSYYSKFLVDHLQGIPVKSVVVLGGFPHSQIPLEIKLKELDHAVRQGIDEIDIVISHHLIQSENYDDLMKELKLLRNHAKELTLKIILETGHFEDLVQLEKVAKLVCESGCDFLKTSTGKIPEGATPEKFKILCKVIKEHFEETGKRIGVKASGGIRTIEQAKVYISMVKETLGEDFLDAKYFRIGASSLLNEI